MIAFLMALMVVNAQITRVPVKMADLPKAITDNITKDHAGFMIKDATKVTENNIVTYDVVINKGNMSHTLIYNKDGKFLRAQPPKTAHTANAGQKAPEKSGSMKK